MSHSGDNGILIRKSIESILKKTLKMSLKNPALACFALWMLHWQNKAAQRRLRWERQGITVPPMMMASITSRCNLACHGCYAQALQRNPAGEMTLDRWKGIMGEAHDLGISIVMLLGGEPFIRHDILQVTRCFPQMIVLVFTNGLLVSREIMNELKRQKHVVPMLSMEGFETETDKRRGEGVHKKIQGIIRELKTAGNFFGASLTVTGDNFTVVTSERYIQGLIASGCSLVFFQEYVPVAKGSEGMALTGAQREKLCAIKNALSAKFHAIFLVFPGSERNYGGCLAVGGGLIHISHDGSLEPCPLIPYSDSSVINASLKETLQSEFLMTIRNNGEAFHKKQCACPLREQQEWINAYFANRKNESNIEISGSAFP